MRASQSNGCAYCLDMHWKDLRASGESEQRLYGLNAWRESPFYTNRERAALEWTEAVTLITHGHVPEEVYEEVHRHFNDKELSLWRSQPSTPGTASPSRSATPPEPTNRLSIDRGRAAKIALGLAAMICFDGRRRLGMTASRVAARMRAGIEARSHQDHRAPRVEPAP